MQIYKCEPEAWTWMPKFFRNILAVITITLFGLSFLSIPIGILLLIYTFIFGYNTFTTIYFVLMLNSWILPGKEW